MRKALWTKKSVKSEFSLKLSISDHFPRQVIPIKLHVGFRQSNPELRALLVLILFILILVCPSISFAQELDRKYCSSKAEVPFISYGTFLLIGTGLLGWLFLVEEIF